MYMAIYCWPTCPMPSRIVQLYGYLFHFLIMLSMRTHVNRVIAHNYIKFSYKKELLGDYAYFDSLILGPRGDFVPMLPSARRQCYGGSKVTTRNNYTHSEGRAGGDFV